MEHYYKRSGPSYNALPGNKRDGINISPSNRSYRNSDPYTPQMHKFLKKNGGSNSSKTRIIDTSLKEQEEPEEHKLNFSPRLN